MTDTEGKDGNFELFFDKVGTYTIEAEIKNMYFPKQTVYVDEKTRILPPFIAEAVNICGKVEIFDENKNLVPSSTERQVYCEQ